MGRSLRVLHVISTPTGVGGAEQVLRHLAGGNAERGHRVLVANPFARSAGDVTAAAEHYAPADYVARVTTGPGQLPAAAGWLDRTVAAFAPDLLHTHLFHAATLAAALPRHGAIRITTQHHGGLLVWRGHRLEARLDAWATRRADHVVAVSDAVRSHVVDACGVRPGDVTVIRNGWSGAPLPHTGSRDGGSIVCVGNLRPEKGHEVLLEAFARVRLAAPTTRLLLVGGGPLDAHLRRQVERLGLADAVTLLGAVADVWPVLAAADVFALAAWQEPLGIAVLEAMSAGLPVVATAVGGIPEILPASAGRLVAPGDAPALAMALLEVVLDPARGTGMGAAGRAQAAQQTAAAMVDAYNNLYDSLVSRARSGRR